MYGTFATHKHRKHTPHTLQDFKPGIISELPEEALDFEPTEEDYEDRSTNAHYEEEDGSNVVVEYIASLLLKLESVHNVSVLCIDELVDLHLIASSAPISSVKSVIVSHFTLSSVYLALLCKAVDIKRFGYDQVLAPLLKDIAVLECDGIYISSVGQNVKGSVFCVAADNLGAHSISAWWKIFLDHSFADFVLGIDQNFK